MRTALDHILDPIFLFGGKAALEGTMARAQTAYLYRKDVPVRKALQEAIDELGFKIKLDDSYAPFRPAGYLPCTLDGEDAGFDMRFQVVAADLPPTLKSSLAGRDMAIGLRWAGDPREELAALTVCAALVKGFSAVVHEPDKDRLLSFDELLAKARDTKEAL
jgi:hypothetical protein